MSSAPEQRAVTVDSGTPPRLAWWLQRLLLVLPAILLLVLGWSRRFLCDDGLINLRVSQNLANGFGPLYNVDERVETYTNPLWVGIIALWDLAGGRVEHGAIALGLAFSVAGVAFGVLGSLQVLRLGGRTGTGVIVPIGALAFVSIAPVWDYTTSGLETGLAFGWLGACYWGLCREMARAFPAGGSPIAAWRPRSLLAVGLGLGPLVRPDLAIYSAVFLGVLFIGILSQSMRAGGSRPLLRASGRWLGLTATAGLLPLLYQVFRMGYFAGIIANSAMVKEPGLPNWPGGLAYLRNFIEPYYLWVPLSLIAIGIAGRLWKSWSSRNLPVLLLVGAPALAGLLNAIYVIRVGGDWMHARMFLPGLMAICLAVMVVRIPWPRRSRSAATALAVSGCVVVACWSIMAIGWLRTPVVPFSEPIIDNRAVHVEFSGKWNPTSIDDFDQFLWYLEGSKYRQAALAHEQGQPVLVEVQEPVVIGGTDLLVMVANPEIAFGDVGYVARHCCAGITGFVGGPEVHLADYYGLADPYGARLMIGARTGKPGHQKTFSRPWYAGEFADLPPGSDPAAIAAQHALGCGILADLGAAVREPMSWGRFWTNMRMSWGFYTLRIPGDPMVAEKQFCGGDPSSADPGRQDRSGLAGIAALFAGAVMAGPGRRRRRA